MDLNLQSRGLVIVVICHGVSLVQDLYLRVKFYGVKAMRRFNLDPF